ncbi:13654_t:CDS:1 [Funneliformis caledonium]|uniref:13654_t:CDS:1 n=1 Tax=Funneliformis caledonium TaxID=1117310 RepID=A0A9N8WFS5_9GLOM|nr:13654_t:CDS:1 [Funneliformis caledonium]
MTLRPPKSSYNQASEKVWFSYVPNASKFQHGLLGINDSYVAGNLHLQFPENEPLKAKRIEVSITGTEYVHWTEQVVENAYNSSTKSYEVRTRTIHYIHEHQILNRSLLLWQNKEFYQKITNIKFPFKLPLPNNLPPSMNLSDGIGQINYEVNAKIKRKRNFWKFKGSKKSVKCMCSITRYRSMPVPAPTRWTEWDDPKAIKRGLGYDITVDYNTFGPGNPIIINFAFKFFKVLKLKEVFAGLKEYHIFKASGNTKFIKGYVLERKILDDQISSNLNARNEWWYNLKIEVPENKVGWTTDRHNIKVYHKIKVKVRFGYLGPKNINLEKLVNIENIIKE